MRRIPNVNHKRLTILMTLALCTSAGATPPAERHSESEWLDAIAMQESGDKDVPDHKDSNGRVVKGRYQISEAYWKDARMVEGEWDQCRTDPVYSRRTVLAYMRRYVPAALAAGDWMTLSRTHNGGPNGAKNPKTFNYWTDIKAIMEGR